MRIKPGTTYAQVARSAETSKWEDYFRFHVKLAGIPNPMGQFKFAESIGRRWAVDFAWPKQKIVVEIEGGIWRRGGGAHSHPMNILRDIEKYNALAMMGYRLFRFSDRELKDGSAIEMMKKVFLEG